MAAAADSSAPTTAQTHEGYRENSNQACAVAGASSIGAGNKVEAALGGYRLSRVLSAHSSDVKDVAFLGSQRLVSVSRDHTALQWHLDSDEPERKFDAHEGFVNSVAILTPGAQDDSGASADAAATSDSLELSVAAIASAGADACILVHSAATGDIIYYLTGHTANVCTLKPVPGRRYGIISGSWDFTARVWENGECVFVLAGHSHAVWAVAAIDANNFITGSADKTIRLWNKQECVRSMEAHTQAVRGIAYIPTLDAAVSNRESSSSATRVAGASSGSEITGTLLSCGNDGVVRAWQIPSLLHKCDVGAHTSFAYAITTGILNSCLSVGEDRTLRIWSPQSYTAPDTLSTETNATTTASSTSALQAITLPTVSVWCVAYCPLTHDIAAGGSDGKVYVFTRDVQRFAPEHVRTDFDKALSSFGVTAGDGAVSSVLGSAGHVAEPRTVLDNPGPIEGYTVVVQGAEPNVAQSEVFRWSKVESRWVQVGKVVDSLPPGGKVMFKGREYDHVFDIDCEGKSLKLPFNVGDNPYSAALSFVIMHNLSTAFVDEIANHIIKHSKAETIDASGAALAGDPYTGAERYIPGSESQIPPNLSTAPPTAQVGAVTVTQPSSTPRNQSTAATSEPLPLVQRNDRVLPVRDYLLYTGTINVAALSKKVAEISRDIGQAENKYSNLADPSSGRTDPNVAVQMLGDETWPIEHRYPAIDVLRAHFVAREQDPDPSQVVAMVITALQKQTEEETPAVAVVESLSRNAVAGFRLFSNLLATVGGRSAINANMGAVLKLANDFRVLENQSLRQAIASTLLNMCIYMARAQDDLPDTLDILAILVEIVNSSDTDAETLYRALAGIGTAAATGLKPVVQYLVPLDVPSILRLVAVTRASSFEPRSVNIALETLALI